MRCDDYLTAFLKLHMLPERLPSSKEIQRRAVNKEKGRKGEMERRSGLELFKLQLVYFDFSSTGFFFFLLPLLLIIFFAHVPFPLVFFPVCSFLFPLTPLSSYSLSLHPFGGTLLLIMPVIGETHTFPVCLDQIKNIVSILPTWPLLAELNGLCSVLSAAN